MANQTITGFYSEDHDRLDGLLKTFQELKHKDFDRAKPNFREFLFGLLRHIVWEEEILFPAFEEKTGMRDSGPTEVMRIEHREIKKCLDALHEKVRARDPNCDAEENALLEVLSAHNQKEENILYPTIDRVTSDAEKDRVFQDMDAVPEEKFAQCCGGHSHAA